MRLVWKGNFTEEARLMQQPLPTGAVRLDQVASPFELEESIGRWKPLLLILSCLAAAVKWLFWGTLHLRDFVNPWGLLLGLLGVLPNECLHALIFPKGAEVQLWCTEENKMLFICSSTPLSKKRYLFMRLFPNLVFGFAPLLLWICIPGGSSIGGFLGTFSCIGLITGAPDYAEIVNTLWRMPKGAMVRLHGYHSYWFFP